MDNSYYKYFALALGVIILDQVVKLWIYTNMDLYEEFNVLGTWFRIHYVENPGIAFGMRADWQYAKTALTLFRLVASGFGVYLIIKYSKKSIHPGALWAGALILAGAIGNSIDSVFYGIFLDNAPQNAVFKLFNGQVVDMLYFPLFEFTWPNWVPAWGGTNYEFFNAIFNIADSSIFIGVVIMLIFQKRFFSEEHQNKESNSSGSAESLANQSMANTISGTEEDSCVPS